MSRSEQHTPAQKSGRGGGRGYRRGGSSGYRTDSREWYYGMYTFTQGDMASSLNQLAPSRNFQPITLKEVSIWSRIINFTAEVVFTQIYQNTENVTLEAIFTFLIPFQATVTAFEALYNKFMRPEIEGHDFVSFVKKKADGSKPEYNDIEHYAYFIDQDKQGCMKAILGLLSPGRTARVQVSYVTELAFENERLRFSLPAKFTPYGRQPKSDDSAQHAGASYKFDLRVDLDMPSPIQELDLSHPMTIAFQEGHRKASLTLPPRVGTLKTDYLLQIRLSEPRVSRVLVQKDPSNQLRVLAIDFHPPSLQKDKRTPIHDLSVEFDASLRPQRHTNPQSNAFDSNRIVVYALLSDGAAAGQVTLKGKHPEGEFSVPVSVDLRQAQLGTQCHALAVRALLKELEPVPAPDEALLQSLVMYAVKYNIGSRWTLPTLFERRVGGELKEMRVLDWKEKERRTKDQREKAELQASRSQGGAAGTQPSRDADAKPAQKPPQPPQSQQQQQQQQQPSKEQRKPPAAPAAKGAGSEQALDADALLKKLSKLQDRDGSFPLIEGTARAMCLDLNTIRAPIRSEPPEVGRVWSTCLCVSFLEIAFGDDDDAQVRQLLKRAHDWLQAKASAKKDEWLPKAKAFLEQHLDIVTE